MQRYGDFFLGKRITMMGLGLLGRGVGDAAFLAQQGAEVLVTDLKDAEVLKPSIDKLKQYTNISFVLGEHRLEDFRQCDFVLKGPGIPLDASYIKEAEKNGVPVYMSDALFAELAGIPVIGVTGTRGKSTVVQMIYEILKEEGREVLLGGNVRGVSTLAQLPVVGQRGVELAVLELDSWRLQGFTNRSPQVAVFTTFYPDHMSYYQGDMQAYMRDKANIFLHQEESDYLIIGAQALPSLAALKNRMRARTQVVGEDGVPKPWQLLVPGHHNRYNAALALAAARSLGVDDEITRRSLECFRGLPGRLELVREVGGVRVYNDTTSTMPEATQAALAALEEAHGRIVLIMGGADKGLDMTALLENIGKTCKALVLLKGTGTGLLHLDALTLPSQTVDTLAEAVEAAIALCEPGDVLLFSPAFASYSQYFNNEFERGDAFNNLVQAL